MMDAWFSPETGRLFAFLSLLALLALFGPVANRGRYKTLVVGLYVGALALGLGMLALTGLAVLQQQPGYVVRPLLVTGIVVTAVFAATLPVILHAYREAEGRRIAARDM